MMTDKLTFFPVGNGDCTMLEADDLVVITDINYRKSTDDNEYFDIAPEIRAACELDNGDYELDVFVLTHPDEDHLGGFPDLFYTGDPDDYVAGENEETLILVKEMWVNPHCLDPNYTTDKSKPVIDEIKRRHDLEGTSAADADGNRLRVLDTDSNPTAEELSESISWRLLAPTPDEADIPKAAEGEENNSTNDSSLVIQWTVDSGGTENQFIIGGDATVDIWERIWSSFKGEKEILRWHVLLGPHHISANSIGRKDDDGDYEESPDARSALENKIDDGFVIASSKEIKDDDDNPPSVWARDRYHEILDKDCDTDVKDRFLNPETAKKGKPATVVFTLSESGPQLDGVKKTAEKSGIAGGYAAATTYGRG